mgnify:CR=1 FL=1
MLETINKTKNYFFFIEGNSASQQETLIENIGKIMTQTTELASKLQAVSAQLEKALVEIKTNTEALQAALATANLELPVEAVEALAKLETLAGSLDALNPDAVVEPAPIVEPVVEPVQEIQPELVQDTTVITEEVQPQ